MLVFIDGGRSQLLIAFSALETAHVEGGSVSSHVLLSGKHRFLEKYFFTIYLCLSEMLPCKKDIVEQEEELTKAWLKLVVYLLRCVTCSN